MRRLLRARIRLKLVLGAVLLAACGPATKDQAARSLLEGGGPRKAIDVMDGTYAGTGLGATIADVKTRLGAPERTGSPAAPAGAQRMRGPMSIPLPATRQTHPSRQEAPPLLRYRNVAFLTDGNRVFTVIVEDPAATTERAVSIGDDLEHARVAYKLRCTTALGWSDDDVYPACFGRVAPGRYVWFGGDPIENISVGTVPLTSAGGYR